MKDLFENINDSKIQIGKMRQDINQILKDYGIENPITMNTISLCLLGVIMPYIIGFIYSDNDSTGEK